MREILVLALLLFTGLSCTSDKNGAAANSTTTASHKPVMYLETDSIYSKSVENYVNTIALGNEVHSAQIGITGTKSDIYSAFEGLLKTSETHELFPLLQHDSTAVRVYAYKAIVLKDSTLQEKAWDAMKGKNDWVMTFSGCIKSKEPISWIVHDSLTLTLQKHPGTH